MGLNPPDEQTFLELNIAVVSSPAEGIVVVEIEPAPKRSLGAIATKSHVENIEVAGHPVVDDVKNHVVDDTVEQKKKKPKKNENSEPQS